MSYQNFTSLPPEQEQSFVVYEQKAVETGKKALQMGIIAGVAVGLLGIILYVSFEPKPHPAGVTKEAKKDSVGAETKPKPAPEPEATPEPEPETAPEAAPEGAAEGAAMEAPEPPKGATKAPPTALVGE